MQKLCPNCCAFTNKNTLSIPNECFGCNFTDRCYRWEKEIPYCIPFARNGKSHSYSPVIISLRRTIHENRIWEEGARITHSVIFRSTALGTLANVFWNTRQAYLPWHEYQRCLFHLATLPEVLHFSLSPPTRFSLSSLKYLAKEDDPK